MKTLAQKLEILDKIKLGYTYQGISDEYGIAKSAITFIKKNEAKYRELSKNYPDTMRRAPSDKVIKIDSEIKEFLRESNQSNKPLSKSLIQEFAKEKHEMNGITNFRGSNGYIFRLAKRLNMKNSNNKTPPATSKPKNPPKKVTKSGAMSTSSQASTQKRQILRYKKLTPNATRPTRASRLSAGLDLCSAYDVLIPSKGKALVKTDLQVRIPDECYGRIVQRSDLALEHFIIVGAGVIDADYRGNVGVALFNLGETDFHVHKGDKIAQLICERICYPLLQEFREDQEL